MLVPCQDDGKLEKWLGLSYNIVVTFFENIAVGLAIKVERS